MRQSWNIMMGKEDYGRTDDSALRSGKHRDQEQHQIVGMWLGEEARNNSLGKQASLIWMFRKPFFFMLGAILVMYYLLPMTLCNYCIIWKKTKIAIILREITFPIVNFRNLNIYIISRSIMLLCEIHAAKQVNRQNVRNWSHNNNWQFAVIWETLCKVVFLTVK